MSRLAALLLPVACAVLALMHHATGEDDTKLADKNKPHLDALGDPLPPAAVARLGTQRFTHGGSVVALAFSPDDKTLYSLDKGLTLRSWDPATGRERGEAVPLAASEGDAAFSPDGKSLAFVTPEYVHLYDLPSGKETRRWPTPDGAARPAFAPDSKSLLWSDEKGTVHLIDLTGERQPRAFAGGTKADQLALSPDGKLLAVLREDSSKVVLWDTTSARRVRVYHAENVRYWSRIAFDGDGKVLVCVGREGMTAFEATSVEVKYSRETREERPAALVLAGDGQTMASVDLFGLVNLWQAQTGKAIKVLPRAGSFLLCAAFSRDGKALAVAGHAGVVRLWDLASGKERAADGRERFTDVTFAKDGRSLVAVSPERITHWSAEGKLARKIAVADSLRLVALVPGGESAVFREGGDGKVVVTSLDRGERAVELDVASTDGLAVDPRGRLLAATADGAIDLWSLRTGKKAGTIRHRLLLSQQEDRFGRRIDGGYRTAPAFSPDGRTLFAAGKGHVTLRFEVAGGGARLPFRLPPGLSVIPAGLTFSPDGRLIALEEGSRVCLCDAWQPRLVRGLEEAGSPHRNFDGSTRAFSPDGKLFAAGCGNDVVIWDVATGERRARLAGHRRAAEHVCFSPDGKRLLSRSDDETVLVWDVAEALKLPPARPKVPAPRSGETLWEALAGDADAAESAVRELASRPDDAVRLLKGHLEPVPPIEQGRLQKLIDALDSEDQGQREQATQRLAALDELARPALEAARKSPSAEVRRRSAAVLERLDALARTGPELRPLRAVEALESADTRAARDLLAALARGAADARLTREAAAALARLEARPPR
jgi:WD40 repeat protein